MNKKIKNYISSAAIFVVFLSLGWFASGFIDSDKISQEQIEISKNILKQEGSEVVVFGTKWCPYCSKAKEELDSRGVIYKWIDIEESEQNNNMFRAFDIDAIPLILTKDKIIRGFKKNELKKI